MKPGSVSEGRIERPVLVAYYLTLLAVFAATFFPHARIWGFNWWSHFPLWLPIVLLGFGLAMPYLLRHWLRYEVTGRDDISARRFFIVGLAIIVTLSVLFVLLRARTHFLGDGYTALANLAADKPLVKYRNLGETLIRIWIILLINLELAKNIHRNGHKSKTDLRFRLRQFSYKLL